MAWILFNKSIKKLTKSERGSVESFFEELSEKYEILRNMKPGYNPSVRHVAFTLEPVQFLHRPLFMYIAVGVLEGMANAILLRACGFQYLEKGGLTYWFRQGGMVYLVSNDSSSHTIIECNIILVRTILTSFM